MTMLPWHFCHFYPLPLFQNTDQSLDSQKIIILAQNQSLLAAWWKFLRSLQSFSKKMVDVKDPVASRAALITNESLECLLKPVGSWLGPVRSWLVPEEGWL